MKKLFKTIFTPPSLRINLVVVCGVVLLLAASLAVMYYFSYQAIHQEARLNAEQTIESTEQCMDNILLSVEQSTGNVYRELCSHLKQPERLEKYCRQLVTCNPYIVGAAVCMEPGYYPGREFFMTYVHRKGGTTKGKPQLVVSDHFGSKPYTEHVWYTQPMTTGRACWTDPQPEEEDEGLTITFCLPIYEQSSDPVGTFVADLSVDLLSQEVLKASDSSNRYCVLLSSDGTFIVHPNQQKRNSRTPLIMQEGASDSEVQQIIQSMHAGETGNHPFRLDGKDWHVFYKPFQQTEVEGRSMEKLKWSIGVVYSEDEAFGSLGHLFINVLVISVLTLLVFYLLSRFVTRWQLKPLRQLTVATQQIAQGHYDYPMPNIRRNDEIGLLYEHFQNMKQALATQVHELSQMTTTLKKRREIMREVYAKEQSVDRVKTSFLHYVTNQMIQPSEDIQRCVNTICDNYNEFSHEELGYVVDTIDKKKDTIIRIVNDVFETANNADVPEERKEENHG